MAERGPGSVCTPIIEDGASACCSLHWGIHIGRSRRPGRTARDHTLGLCPRVKESLSRSFRGGGPHLYGRRFSLDIGWNDGGDRSCLGNGRARPWRRGGQSQFSALLDLEPKTDRIQKALTYARLNLQKDLSVEALADVAGLSPRQFSRAFHEETSQSPAKAIEHLRVEAARLMLEEGRLPIEVIASEVGFGDRERMRRSFIRNIGHPPASVRRNASQKRTTGTAAHTTS